MRSPLVAFCLSALFACSSSSSTGNSGSTQPLSCQQVTDSPQCPGYVEFSCTGTGSESQREMLTGSDCMPGPAANGGASLFCCAGCSNPSTSADCPAASASGVTYDEITCSPGQSTSTDCAKVSTGAHGEGHYCCPTFTVDPIHVYSSCIAQPTGGTCMGGGVLTECPGTELPPNAFTCSLGTPLPTAENGDAFCCLGPSEATDTCTPTPGANVECNGSATPYVCSSAKRPEDLDPSVACSAVGLMATASAQIGYCCIPFQAGACKPDAPNAIGCLNTALVNFTCSGTAKPTDVDPKLLCTSANPTGLNGTQYCCETL